MIPFLAQTILYWFSNGFGMWLLAATCSLPSRSPARLQPWLLLACSSPCPIPQAWWASFMRAFSLLWRLPTCGHGQLFGGAYAMLFMESSSCGTWGWVVLPPGRGEGSRSLRTMVVESKRAAEEGEAS